MTSGEDREDEFDQGRTSSPAEDTCAPCQQTHLQTSPPTSQKFRKPKTTFENTPLYAPKYSIMQREGSVGGGSCIFLLL